jgi:S-DNA-T family DNA segregation ATPase FtsK/SpoIIIE
MIDPQLWAIPLGVIAGVALTLQVVPVWATVVLTLVVIVTLLEIHDRMAGNSEPSPEPLPPPPPPPPAATPAGVYDAAAGRSLLGYAVGTGEAVHVTWSGNAGCIVGGVPGSGKTASLMPVIAGLSSRAELWLADGKSSYDLQVFAPVAAMCSRSAELDALVEPLAKLEQMIELRATAVHTATGRHDFWSVPVADREALELFPVFLIIDEAQVFLTVQGLRGDEKSTVEGNIRAVRGLVQRGRFAGITTILTSQKPSAATFPTLLRDLCSNKIAFRCTTAAQARTVLGDVPDDAPAPSAIPGTAKGQCVVVSDSGAAVLVQAGYMDHKSLERYIAGVRKVPDQFEVATRLAGKRA